MHILKVTGMSCGHCVRAITGALQAVDPTAEVQVDLVAREVRVRGRLSLEQSLAAIRGEALCRRARLIRSKEPGPG